MRGRKNEEFSNVTQKLCEGCKKTKDQKNLWFPAPRTGHVRKGIPFLNLQSGQMYLNGYLSIF